MLFGSRDREDDFWGVKAEQVEDIYRKWEDGEREKETDGGLRERVKMLGFAGPKAILFAAGCCIRDKRELMDPRGASYAIPKESVCYLRYVLTYLTSLPSQNQTMSNTPKTKPPHREPIISMRHLLRPQSVWDDMS